MRTEQANERLSGELKGAARHAGDLVSETASRMSEPRNRIAAVVDAANATCRRLEDQTFAAVEATDRCIRGHPYEALSVAFGLGLITGVLLSRK